MFSSECCPLVVTGVGIQAHFLREEIPPGTCSSHQMDLSSWVIPASTPGKGNPVSKRCLWSLQHLIIREAKEKEGKNKKIKPTRKNKGHF